MRRLVVSLLSALLLLSAAGCGGDDSSKARDAPTSSPSSKPAPGTPIHFTVVGIVSETAAGGTVSPAGVPLMNDDDVDGFAGQFKTPGLASKLHDLIEGAEVPDGKVDYAAVIDVGCTPPSKVTVTESLDGLSITAVKGAKQPNIECLAAETTVAVVRVDEKVVNRG